MAVSTIATTLILVASCRQVVGLDDPPVAERCANVDFATQECASCVDASCCEEAVACDEDATCGSWLACVAGCGGDECLHACDANATWSSATAAFRACQATNCPAACDMPCGAARPGTNCDSCADDCCAEERRCQQSLDCNLLRVCEDACAPSDAACGQRCRQQHHSGASLRQTVDECIARRCDVEIDLSCLGAVAWPQASTDRITVLVRASDFVSGLPLAGVTVEGCNHGDPACTPPPFGTHLTGAGGIATLDVQLTTSNYVGFVTTSGEGLAPALWYFFPPLAADATRTVGATSNVALSGILDAAGVELDTSRGQILIAAEDCSGRNASGLKASATRADGASRTVYFDATLVDANADATTDSGVAGIANLPPGITTVRLEHARTCQTVAEVDVLVRAGTTTVMILPPTP